MAGEAIGLLLTLAILGPGCHGPCLDHDPVDVQDPVTTDLEELPGELTPPPTDDLVGTGPLAPTDLRDLLHFGRLLDAHLPGATPGRLAPATAQAWMVHGSTPDRLDAQAPLEPAPSEGPSTALGPTHPIPPATTGPTVTPHAVTERPGIHGVEEAAGPSATAAGLLAALAAIGLYHRLTKKRLLAHEGRQRILEMLADQPGMGTPEVAKALGCCYRTARHHLDKLAAFDMVVCQRLGSRTVWSLPTAAGRARAQLSDHAARLLDALRQEPGLHLSGLARKLSISKATAKHHLDKLVERGLVEDSRIGPLRCFSVTEDG